MTAIMFLQLHDKFKEILYVDEADMIRYILVWQTCCQIGNYLPHQANF